MVTTVRISETYDLSTQVNKMGFVAIHTPSMMPILKQWKGLAQNHKFVKLLGCDVAMACASMLPADPLQIGVEAGDIAPQDMFNPILYKAVSNDTFNQFTQWMKNNTNVPDIESMSAPGEDPNSGYGSIAAANSFNFCSGTEADPTSIDQFDMYYGLLANSDGWRKAMPQAGLEMNGLFPMVFTLETTASPFGVRNGTGVESSTYAHDAQYECGPSKFDGENNNYASIGTVLRGDAKRMGAIPTYVYQSGGGNKGIIANKIPRAYVGVIVLPPAKLNRLFYRLKVTWTIEFSGVRSLADTMNWATLANLGMLTYATDYDEQSKMMENKTELVDTRDTGIQKIMESAR